MTIRCVMLSLMIMIAVPPKSPARGADPIPLRVLYLARNEAPERTQAFDDFLSERFQRCVVESREDFTSDMLDDIDVVVFDWSQRERTGNQSESPLGPLEQWTTPMVLLGSAGLHMANAWQIIGDAG